MIIYVYKYTYIIKMICKHIFKSGRRKDEVCGYKNCNIHDEYNCNLNRYMGLPKGLCESKFSKENYFKIVSIYETLKSTIALTRDNDIKEITNLMLMLTRQIQDNILKNNKTMIFVFLDVLDDILAKITNGRFDKFRGAMNAKLSFMIDDDYNDKKYKKYVIDNYQLNRRFYSIKLNKRYYRRKLGLLFRLTVIMMKTYQNTCKKLYSPDGMGYYMAQDSFTKGVQNMCIV